MATFTINTDGGSRGNPGPAAVGVVIKKDGAVVGEWGQTIGSTTNNQAEYQAVDLAVAKLSDLVASGDQLQFILDSELVVRQIMGQYKVKDAGLQVWHRKIVNELTESGWDYSFISVPRAQNKAADALVNAALDAAR